MLLVVGNHRNEKIKKFYYDTGEILKYILSKIILRRAPFRNFVSSSCAVILLCCVVRGQGKAYVDKLTPMPADLLWSDGYYLQQIVFVQGLFFAWEKAYCWTDESSCLWDYCDIITEIMSWNSEYGSSPFLSPRSPVSQRLRLCEWGIGGAVLFLNSRGQSTALHTQTSSRFTLTKMPF